MPNGELRHYACGYTTHQMRQLMHGQPRERRVFPAGVFLYCHPDGRKVLFDTGYGPATWRAGVSGFLYSLLLPPRIRPPQSIGAQLRADGMNPETIDFVVLSHLHPDHVGGVRYFPRSTFVLSAAMLETLAKSKLKEGFLPRLLPRWFPAAKKLVVDPGVGEVDLLGDGSYRIIDLPGHAKGHMGALVEGQALLAGDASWGADLMDGVGRIKPLPRSINHDWNRYEHTVQALQQWQDSGVTLYFSHDQQERKDLLGPP